MDKYSTVWIYFYGTNNVAILYYNYVFRILNYTLNYLMKTALQSTSKSLFNYFTHKLDLVFIVLIFQIEWLRLDSNLFVNKYFYPYLSALGAWTLS